MKFLMWEGIFLLKYRERIFGVGQILTKRPWACDVNYLFDLTVFQ
jgi:hypothetical protein